MIDPNVNPSTEWQLEDAADLAGFDLSSLSVRDWTSEDYSRIFVKYRPRLVNYASKFLSDPGSVDEVVQDAFLYLFMSLPELDSELGVLKYLKWKTRYLALDMLRAQGKRPALFAVAEDAEELVEPEAAPDDFLSGVDDAAIVNLALSRIPDRQREVLVRSVLDQESARQIGDSMGMTENATRQLLHRARASFREQVAMVAADHNTTISAFLSTAVKKAKDAGVKGAAMILLLAIPALGVGMLYRGIGWNPSDAPAIVQSAPSTAVTPPSIETSGEPVTEPTEESVEPSEELKTPVVDSSPSVDPTPETKPTPEQTADEVSALALEKTTDVTVTSRSVLPNGASSYLIQTVDGLSVDFSIEKLPTTVEFDASFTLMISDRPTQLPVRDLSVARRVVNDGQSIEITVTAYLMNQHLTKADRVLTPEVIVITVLTDLDYSDIQSAEIYKV